MKIRRDMKIARSAVKLATIGLAGYGAQQLWVRYRVPVTTMAHDASRAVETQIVPAVQEGARSVGNSGKAAVTQVKDAARDAVDLVTDGVGAGQVGAGAADVTDADGTGLRLTPDADATGLTFDDRSLAPTELSSDRRAAGRKG